MRLNISLDDAGRHLFTSAGNGRLVTYIDIDAWRLLDAQDVRCPLLKLIALAVPSIPYAAVVGMNWLEPVPLPPKGYGSWMELQIMQYLRHSFPYLMCTCTAVARWRRSANDRNRTGGFLRRTADADRVRNGATAGTCQNPGVLQEGQTDLHRIRVRARTAVCSGPEVSSRGIPPRGYARFNAWSADRN